MPDITIDAVVTWVNGDDDAWKKKMEQFKTSQRVIDLSPSRYRDWGNLHFVFRGIEKYAPWIDRVFLITDEQVPKWLNTTHPKVKIVDHREYIPHKYLPTFNSRVIELNLHRIEDLSECFILINDDCFFTDATTSEMFFYGGLPVDIFMEYPIMCGGYNRLFSQMLANTFNTVGKYYTRAEYKRILRKKILSPKYGKYFFYNFIQYVLPYPKFFGLLTPHFHRPYLKSSIARLWEIEPKLMAETCTHRFKNAGDVNIYLARIMNMMSGNFIPGNVFRLGRSFFVQGIESEVCDAIKGHRFKMICVNDDCDEETFLVMRDLVNKSLQACTPEKCAFER